MLCVHCKQNIPSGAVQCPCYTATICGHHCHECKYCYDWLSGEWRCGYLNDHWKLKRARLQAIAIAEKAAAERKGTINK